MIIKKLILHKFKRFSLANIDHYEYTPKSNINIFTDRNGAGKTSLLGQLNPLPPDIKKDFKEDGYKYIEISHNGNEYKITSKGNKHSILKDDIELNTGGTRKVQLELIESIFNLNHNSLNVINGVHPFSVMTPSDRKKYLTEISTVDYSYAISIFQKLQERRRDLSAWVKLYNEKSISITNILNSITNYEEMVNIDLSIKKVIEGLLREYIHINNTPDLSSLLLQLSNKNKEFKQYEYLYDVNLETYIQQRDKVSQQLSIKSHELNKQLELLANLQTNGDKEKLEELNKRLEELNKKLIRKPDTWKLDNLQSIYNHLISRVNEFKIISQTLNDLPGDNIDLKMLEQQIMDKQVFLSKIDDALNKQNNIKNDYNSIALINLPACKSCGEPYDLSSFIDITKTNIEKLSNRLDVERKLLDEMMNKKNNYIKRDNIISFLTNVFKTDEYVKSSFLILNRSIPDTFENHSIDFAIEVVNIVANIISTEFIPLLIEKDRIMKELTPLLETSLLSKKDKLDHIAILTKLVEELTTNKQTLQNELKKIDQYINDFHKMSVLRNDIRDLLEKINEARKVEKIKFENDYIEKTILTLKEKNIENNKLLEQYNVNKKELDVIKGEKDKTEREIYLTSKLLDVLSPSSGLIAKSINSFLGVFIEDMNIIINSVWSYKLKILPCDLLEGDDLDYRFKVEVNDSFTVDDVSKLSSSMREIVDLAFRLIYIKYKNFDKIPIVLDEFGRTMDKEHRINAFNMIDQVIANNFDQIFLVSHFEEMYGRFRNADFPEIK